MRFTWATLACLTAVTLAGCGQTAETAAGPATAAPAEQDATTDSATVPDDGAAVRAARANEETTMTYAIRRAESPPPLDADWDDPAWRQAETAAITHFHPRSSEHRPDVRARVLYDDAGLYVMFRTEDRYVLARHTEYQDPVATDSCVEFFVQPGPDAGYFNFEVNAIGTMLLYYITEPEKMLDGGVPVPRELAETIRMHTSLDGPITEEITEPVTYTVAYFVPWPVFEEYVGGATPDVGSEWRGNFYKCADATSHPHWGAWAPIGEKLSFHQPSVFGTLRFEETAP